MKKTIILVFLFLQTLALLSQGWSFVGEIKQQASILDVTHHNDTLVCLVIQETKTLLERSTDGGDNWVNILEYDWWNDNGKWEERLNNPSILTTTPHNHQYWIGGFFNDLGFLVHDNSISLFDKVFIDDGPEISEFDVYDSLVACASSTKVYYITRDGWETVDSVPKGDSPFRANSDLNMLNDSIIEQIVYEIQAKQYYFCHLNINTFEWDTLGYLSEHPFSFRAYDKVNEHLIYGIAGESNGVGDQQYDIIYRSRDGGKTWELQYNSNDNPKFGLYKISFIDELNGIAIGNSGKVIMTNNGGKDWVEFDFEDVYIDPYGPIGVELAWYKKKPLITGLGGEIYRYEGDFFNPNYEKAKQVELWIPEDNENKAESSMTFRWDRLNQADYDYYHLQITDNQNYNRWLRPYKEVKDVGNSQTVHGFEKDKRYYWRVVTVDGSKTTISEERTFTIGDVGNNILEPPMTLMECDSVYDADDTLRWTKVDGANRYRVQVSLNSDSLLYDVITIDTFAVADGSVIKGIDHKYRVRSYNETDSSTWSPYCKLWYRLDPPTITAEECAKTGFEKGDTLAWKLEGFAVNSIMKIYSDEDGEDLIKEFYPNNTIFILWNDIEKLLRPSTRYYWSVSNTLINSSITRSHESEICSFVTGPNTSIRETDFSTKIIVQDGLIEAISNTPISTLTLIDISGRQVATSQMNTLRTNHLSAGIYFLVIDGKSNRKVVVR